MSASREQTIYWYRSLWAELFFTRRGGKVTPSLLVRVFSDKVAFALRYVDGSGQSPAIFAMRAGACSTQCCHLCQTCVLTSHSPLVIISRTFTPEEFPGKIYISARLFFAFGSLCGEFGDFLVSPAVPLVERVVRKVLHKYFVVPWSHWELNPWVLKSKKFRPTNRSYKIVGLCTVSDKYTQQWKLISVNRNIFNPISHHTRWLDKKFKTNKNLNSIIPVKEI